MLMVWFDLAQMLRMMGNVRNHTCRLGRCKRSRICIHIRLNSTEQVSLGEDQIRREGRRGISPHDVDTVVQMHGIRQRRGDRFVECME